MPMDHEMWMWTFAGGWVVMGMAQVVPVLTVGAPFLDDSPLNRTRPYLTQPVAMINVEAPGSLATLRVTPNFEGITQRDGELTFGAWGEGFIDARHPHTIVHEAMLSLNLWNFAGGAFSISAGKGFAPYGTDDPMSRPVLKYPTNHHLSQLLERWTLNGVYLINGWGIEAGLFGGQEPDGPYDFSNIESFGNSFSTRVSKRFGEGFGPMAAWEVSASFARVQETREGEDEADVTTLYNLAFRHDASYAFGHVYGLVEGSLSQSDEEGDYFSILGETQIELGRHQPYYRIEYATRPEYSREAASGDGFFQYDHDALPIGETRWLINSVGYGYRLTDVPFSVRAFVEAQHNVVWEERGGIEPEALFGADNFWALSLGVRLYFGGEPMRMGAYGVLDPMTVMHREMESPQ